MNTPLNQMLSSMQNAETAKSENDLIAPALLVLAQADRTGHGPVSTFQLHDALRDAFDFSPEDEELVRPDRPNLTRFLRTVRNLVSHDRLTAPGFAVRTDKGFSITPRGRAHLLQFLLDPRQVAEDAPLTVLENGERVLENTVALQMLHRLAELQWDNKRPVSTAQLRKDIKALVPLAVQDLAPLKNRSDTKVDQIVRNIVSHNTLTKNKWATRSDKGFVITNAGKAKVLDILLHVYPQPDFGILLKKENGFRASVNARRAEVASEAAATRRLKQRP